MNPKGLVGLAVLGLAIYGGYTLAKSRGIL